MCVFVGENEDRDKILCGAVAFAHLHREFLRSVDVKADIIPWIGGDMAEAMVAKKNPADGTLLSIAGKISKLVEKDAISGFGQMTISQTMSSLAPSQAGCERIFTTSLPFVHSLLVRRTTYLYC